MRCASALSTNPVPARAIGEAVADLLGNGFDAPDLLIVTLTPTFSGASEDIAKVIQAALDPALVLTVVASVVMAAGNEVDQCPSVGLWAIWADESSGERVSGFAIGQSPPPLELNQDQDFNEANLALLFVQDWSPSIQHLLQLLDQSPSAPKICGGLLSRALESHALIDGSGRSPDGFLIAIKTPSADLEFGFGSSPISSSIEATSTVGTMLCEIGHESALDYVQAILRVVPLEDRERTARDLALGVLDASGRLVDVVKVLGADSTTGSLALAKPVRQGDRVEFHVFESHGAPLGIDSALDGERANGAFLFATDSLTDASEDQGIGDLGRVTELLGTSAFAGVQVASIIGALSGRADLIAAPFSATIFGRMHY